MVMATLVMAVAGCSRSSSQGGGSSASPTKVMASDQWLIAAAMRESPPAHWRKKVAELSDAQLRQPGLAWAIASLHESEGDASESARWSRKAIDLEPDLSMRSVQVVVRRGLAAGEYPSTLNWLERLQQSHPTQTEICRIRYGLHLRLYQLEPARDVLHELIRQRKFDAFTLEALVVPKYNLPPDKSVAELVGDDTPVEAVLGPAMYSLDQEEYEDAITLFKKILRVDPTNMQAYAGYGLALVRSDRLQDFQSVLQSLADDQLDDLSKHDHFWSSLGLFSERTSPSDDRGWLLQAQIHYAWRATQLVPDSRPYLANLISALNRCGSQSGDDGCLPKSNDASTGKAFETARETVAKRLAVVSRLYEGWEQSREVQHQQAGPCLTIAESLLQLDRVLEAEAWSAIAFSLAKQDDDRRLLERIASFRREAAVALAKPDRKREEVNLNRLMIDATWFADMDFGPSKLLSHQRILQDDIHSASSNSSINYRLSNVADRWGLNHLGSEGPNFNGPLVPLVYQFGCGGGVIDFDLDGWQDLYLTAAGNDARSSDQPANSMYRNLGGRMRLERSVEVPPTNAFSQGVAVGDVNEDGFPDLWVMNHGNNQLLENKGDGTFEVREAAAGETTAWSTSGAIADLDADGFSDLVAVNYVERGKKIYDHCRKDGSVTLCSIAQFQPAENEIYFGSMGGDFVRHVDPAVSLDVGRSLGLLVGRMRNDATAMFVANDLTPNELIEVSSSYPQPDVGRGIRSVGVASGLAFAEGGETQASMGIAGSDWDNNLELDFYVTGFSDEPDAFYRQVRGDIWIDEIKRSGTDRLSRSRVGFGCVALDLDGDGNDELAITNGHISDLNQTDGTPFSQPFDVFRWQSEVQSFIPATVGAEVPVGAVAYHATNHVGRSIFVMDLDRDLDPDLCITHLHERVALLKNGGQSQNRFVAIRLVGRRSARDAVGTHITFTVETATGAVRRRVFRTAGYGFMASGEPILRFGVGKAKKISDVQIQWPSGVVQNVGSLLSARLHLVVEDQQPWMLDELMILDQSTSR